LVKRRKALRFSALRGLKVVTSNSVICRFKQSSGDNYHGGKTDTGSLRIVQQEKLKELQARQKNLKELQANLEKINLREPLIIVIVRSAET